MLSLNKVFLTGRLAYDPQLTTTASGKPVCGLYVVSSTRAFNTSTREWEDKVSYFDVSLFDGLAKDASQSLHKGVSVMISGHLEWRGWKTNKGEAREDVFVVAHTLRLLNEPSYIQAKAVQPKSFNTCRPRPDRSDVLSNDVTPH
jgi:single-strand DNA-binding protein